MRRKLAIPRDYVVYLQELDFDIVPQNNLVSFLQAMSGENPTLWHKAMEEERESMAKNQVWDLVELPWNVSHWL